MTAGMRIPVSLQRIFTMSQNGEDVNEIAPPDDGTGAKIFQPKERGPVKVVNAPGATALRRQVVKKHESAADVYRKTNPNVQEKKHADDTPQAFLDKELKARGYSIKKYVSLEGGYYSKPTLLQKASYGSRMNESIIKSDETLLRRLLDAGLSPNPCNNFGESLVHRICRRGDHKLLNVLLEKGCCIQIADDYGRTPLHDAFWKADPCPKTLHLVMRADKHLIRMMDCRGFLPLDYVRKEAYPIAIKFLEDYLDEFFPHRGPDAKEEPAPPLTRKKPDTCPVPDPRFAVSPQSAALVANGEIEPEDAFAWDQGDDEEDDEDDEDDYDSDESSYYSDSDDDIDDEEMAELCMRAGGPLAIARNCFGQKVQVLSRDRKLN